MNATLGDGPKKGRERLSPKFILGTIEADAIHLMDRWERRGEKAAKAMLKAEFDSIYDRFIDIADKMWADIQSGKTKRRTR
jgi:hypothetical protein